MVNFPSFPTGSLYTGSFPSFPTISWGWGFTIFGVHEGFSITLPDFLKIPEWIVSLVTYGVLWAIGWVGAVFEFALSYAEAEAQTISTSFLNWVTNLFTELINAMEGLVYKTGIFAPLISIVLMSALIIGAIVALVLVFNAASKGA